MSYGMCGTWVLSLCLSLPYFFLVFVWPTNVDEISCGTKAFPLVCQRQVQFWMFNSHLSFLSGSLFYECKYKQNDTYMYNIAHMQSIMTVANPKQLKITILFKMSSFWSNWPTLIAPSNVWFWKRCFCHTLHEQNIWCVQNNVKTFPYLTLQTITVTKEARFKPVLPDVY